MINELKEIFLICFIKGKIENIKYTGRSKSSSPTIVKQMIYTTRNKVTYGTNTAVHSYKKVLKGECSETNINL